VTEAQSYLRLALSSSSITPEEDVYARLTTEDFALDSFQNLLFSIARFKEFTGRYPNRISVVGYEFKKPRFENLHRAAIRWPENKFTYYGIDPYDSEHVHEAIEGEVRVLVVFFHYFSGLPLSAKMALYLTQRMHMVATTHSLINDSGGIPSVDSIRIILVRQS